jgi:hypothetical protein
MPKRRMPLGEAQAVGHVEQRVIVDVTGAVGESEFDADLRNGAPLGGRRRAINALAACGPRDNPANARTELAGLACSTSPCISTRKDSPRTANSLQSSKTTVKGARRRLGGGARFATEASAIESRQAAPRAHRREIENRDVLHEAPEEVRCQRRTSNGARRRSSAGLRSKKFAGFSSNDSFSPESTGQSSACVTWWWPIVSQSTMSRLTSDWLLATYCGRPGAPGFWFGRVAGGVALVGVEGRDPQVVADESGPLVVGLVEQRLDAAVRMDEVADPLAERVAAARR